MRSKSPVTAIGIFRDGAAVFPFTVRFYEGLVLLVGTRTHKHRLQHGPGFSADYEGVLVLRALAEAHSAHALRDAVLLPRKRVPLDREVERGAEVLVLDLPEQHLAVSRQRE